MLEGIYFMYKGKGGFSLNPLIPVEPLYNTFKGGPLVKYKQEGIML